LSRFAFLVLIAALAGCSGDYSPNTYNTAAVQQANKVERGVIVGLRDVKVTSKGTTGAVAGAAAGGVAGSQAPGGVGSALGAIGGSLVGSIVGTSVEQSTSDTPAVEYVVQKENKELVSVTQTDPVTLAIGQKVLVIAGPQARIVADYTIEFAPPKPPAPPTPLPAVPETKPALPEPTPTVP
jgi:outer membrane lipoprotein SlyB